MTRACTGWMALIAGTLSLAASCAAPWGSNNLSPAVDTMVGVKKVITTTVTPGRDLTVGGGMDSVALWLAIGALGISAISYPIQRKVRLWRKNGKAEKSRG